MDTFVYFYTFIFVYFSKTNKSSKNYNVVLNIGNIKHEFTKLFWYVGVCIYI